MCLCQEVLPQLPAFVFTVDLTLMMMMMVTVGLCQWLMVEFAMN